MNRDSALQTLHAGDPQSRRLAVRTLGQWNDPEALTAIVGALSDSSRDVQEAASDTLLEVGDARTIRLLIPLLRSDSPSARNFARLVLERLGKADPQLIIQLTHDADARIRIFCANILGGMCDHDFAPALLFLLEDSDVNVRDAAIVALGRLGASEAVPKLAGFLRAPEPWLRFSAIDALSKIPGGESARALLDALPAMDADLRETVVEAAGQQGWPESVDRLLALLGSMPALCPAIVRALSGPLGNTVRARLGAPGREPLAAALAAELDRTFFKGRGAAAAVELLADLAAPAYGALFLRALESGLPAVGAAATAALHRIEPNADDSLRRQIQAAFSRLAETGKDYA
jgi:HEAT repeat protein